MSEEAVRQFIETTVKPAFEATQENFEKLGRHIYIYDGREYVELSVYADDKLEFQYIIKFTTDQTLRIEYRYRRDGKPYLGSATPRYMLDNSLADIPQADIVADVFQLHKDIVMRD